MSGDSREMPIPSDVQRRVIDGFVKRWAAILGLAVMVGTVILPSIVWAITLRRDVDSNTRRISALEAQVERNSATFRLVCSMATDKQKADADANCPTVYGHRPP